MHFALPPRKTSHPPPYARATAARNSSDRRQKLYQLGSYVVFGILTIYLIFHYVFSSRHAGEEEIESIPPGTPPVVIVTVLDEEHMSPDYIKKIKTNREDYASRHGNPPLPNQFQPSNTNTSPPLQAT
jgi:mannan polymerase II complex MNN11 subunit